jgi:hypothetical protein
VSVWPKLAKTFGPAHAGLAATVTARIPIIDVKGFLMIYPFEMWTE